MKKFLNKKEAALYYRKKGYSYSMIAQKTGVGKSMLSYWLKDVKFLPNERVLRNIKLCIKKLTVYAQKKALERQKKRKQIKDRAKKQIKHLALKNLWLIGSVLYLAEGGKKIKEVKITNSDPRIIKLVINWLTKVCHVNFDDIQATIHIYPDNNEVKSIKYWSLISGVPRSQFQKTQIDTRIKKSTYKHGSLPYGTLHLRVKKSNELYYKIMGWSEGILEKSNQLHAGIV